MKHGKKLVALLLVFCLCFGMSVPTYAADRGTSRKPGYSSGFGKGWNDFWDWLSGKFDKDNQTGNGLPKLKLVEDETTVKNGDLLRAATYAVDEPAAPEDTATVKYFPITMYDYDQVIFNDVLKKQEFTPDLKQWNGMYMGNGDGKYTYTGKVIYGGPENGNVYYEKVSDPLNNMVAGEKYVLVNNAFNAAVGVNVDNQLIQIANPNGITDYKNTLPGAIDWIIEKQSDGTYYVYYTVDNVKYYMNIPTGWSDSAPVPVSTTPQKLVIENGVDKDKNEDINSIALTSQTKWYTYLHANRYYIDTTFTIWEKNNHGSAFSVYKQVEGSYESDEIITEERTYGFAPHNKWTAYTNGTDGTANGNRIYQGLVGNTLDANGQLQFNKLDAGLFTEKAFDGKEIFTNVGLPFKYDSTTQRYSFNAKEMGAWFEGGAASNKNLTYSKVPQAHTAGQDTTAAGWFPFDDSTNTEITSVKGAEHTTAIDAKNVGAKPNHYFGMAASIDFTMTPDGIITDKENGKETPIDFRFSGDDDVWVFIDGKLVLDMGGIHNRIDGHINFKEGKWGINQTWKSNAQAEDINNGTKNTSGDLWETLGVKDLVTFAATETHTLSVFYLERGAGASNCEISFNLPMKDYVNITKDATKDSEGTTLTEEEQETVNNMDFTYTIYRNGEPYVNKVYTILNATTGNAVGTAYTNANGQFTIKNNQTARFTTAFSEKGEIWYVEEMDPGAAFVNDETKWSSTSVTVNGEQKGSNTGLTSNSVEVAGSEEASGKINFLCENILDAKLANPGIVTTDDRIVIDYGLPVQIDVKNNDLFRADAYKIVEIKGAKFGNVEITDAANGQLEYQLTEQLTDVEVLTYTVEVSSTVLTHPEIPGSDETHTETALASAKVYIIPATSMYYEENFKNADGTTNMIKYTKNQWSPEGTTHEDYQEPGVVKTTTDSPYGSDVAYMQDTTDSNGTSMYASSANANPAFQYTFTGTGTSFFARTTNESGYLKVTVKDDAGKVVPGGNRLIDTRFLNGARKTLYNIPIYTLDKLDYGTYTVTVTVCMNGTATNYGTDFWLDGIRVQEPMNPKSENYSIAETAYSDDGEANVNIETLRDKLIDASGYDKDGNLVWEDGFAVLTDINGNITSAADYESIGPKQEVYLTTVENSEGVTNGQKVSFTLEQWDMNHKLYLGLKAPMGTATVKINGKELTVSNTPDCYYNLSDAGYITVDEDNNAKIEIEAVSGVVSITNIKTTGAVEFEIIPGEDIPGDSDIEAE